MTKVPVFVYQTVLQILKLHCQTVSINRLVRYNDR